MGDHLGEDAFLVKKLCKATPKLKDLMLLDEYLELFKDKTQFKQAFLDMDWAYGLMTDTHGFLEPISINIVVSPIGSPISRSILAPILHNLNKCATFGLVHTALNIGPFLIDWNDSALCIPRKSGSQGAIIAVEVGTIKTMDALRAALDTITKFIIYWNGSMNYENYSKTTKHKNCHDFTMDLLKELKLELKPPPEVLSFMDFIKKTGSEQMIFECDSKFQKLCKIKKEKTIFKTHKELDEFVLDILKHSGMQTLQTFKKTYEGYYHILNGLDIAFWLRKQSMDTRNERAGKIVVDDSSVVPLHKGCENICPFCK